jgi:hypothetical protein
VTVATEFRLLAQEMREAYLVADDGMAHRELAVFAPQASDTCTGGGTITVAGAGSLGYTYTNCVLGGYTFNGTATMTPGGSSTYEVDPDSVSVTGPNGYASTLTGSSSCVVGTPTKCTTTEGGFKWGYDINYDAATALAKGTHQCTCGAQLTWNVVFDDFGAGSGMAYVYATNGTAIVERTGDKTFLVTRQIGTALFDEVLVTLP